MLILNCIEKLRKLENVTNSFFFQETAKIKPNSLYRKAIKKKLFLLF